MTFIYIILGIAFIALAVFLLDYRDKMTKNIYMIKEYKNEVNHLNSQLDDISETLKSLDESLSKIQDVSKKILKRFN
ncbi:MAG: hypothetical protein LUG60_03345 [Erysipelotrichaceae bacterium]|nr:hypothetical protein [Erysipelotrichaceae bacterium]